jgi:predicted outer membrane lipoprotein
MDEKEVKEVTRKIEQKLIVYIFLLGGLIAVALGIINPVFFDSMQTWRMGLIVVLIGAVMSVIGWRLKKKYQVSFS